MSVVRRLRPKVHDKAAALIQHLLELPLPLQPATRVDLTAVLSAYAPEPWPFIMLSTDMNSAIVRQISRGPRSGKTGLIWLAVLTRVAWGTGEIVASRKELADLAGTTEREVSRAMSRLVELKALLPIGRGKYQLHPRCAWAGPDAERRAAERELHLVEPS